MSKELLPTIGACILAILLGYFVGRIIDIKAAPIPPTRIITVTGSTAPTVQLKAIEGNELTGIIKGDARFFLGTTPVSVTASGSFRAALPKGSITAAAPAPNGMKFVASKRGKKYYPVSSTAAAKLSVQNRVFFPTKEAAEAAGFTP